MHAAGGEDGGAGGAASGASIGGGVDLRPGLGPELGPGLGTGPGSGEILVPSKLAAPQTKRAARPDAADGTRVSKRSKVRHVV